ncbi:MAG TPA: Spo0E family sporulation regulatory protein-aspartic acid phosphatase [Bacillota bacterium]|nr:Spo0E family sporulation regulatory protein-aspartic acid phosphatase [Bacillota bacterium]
MKLKAAKELLAKVYERKGVTDLEVLEAGTEVDRLLNEYEALLKKKESVME